MKNWHKFKIHFSRAHRENHILTNLTDPLNNDPLHPPLTPPPELHRHGFLSDDIITSFASQMEALASPEILQPGPQQQQTSRKNLNETRGGITTPTTVGHMVTTFTMNTRPPPARILRQATNKELPETAQREAGCGTNTLSSHQ